MRVVVLGDPASYPPYSPTGDQQCINPASGLNTVCTANDVFFGELVAKNVSIYTCASAGDTVNVKFFGVAQAGSPTRYDIGFYLDLSGGDARTGNGCYHGFFQPVCASSSANVGCVNLTGGQGPFYNADGDTCGDIVQSFQGNQVQWTVDLPMDPQHLNRFLAVPCVDADNNGIIDIGTCISWDNNGGNVCSMWNQTVPNTPSKCRCERINIGLPLHPGGGDGGGGSNPGPIIGAVFGALLAVALLSTLGFFAFVVLRRRRKAKPAPPPPKPVEEPAPVPVARAAAPAPVVDKPKDYAPPGTRYIGFGQANIKVKWGADAPPSAPRGHDKYDRWSMLHAPAGAPMPASPSAAAASGSAAAAEGGGSSSAVNSASAASSSGSRLSCCAKLFPCCFARSSVAQNNNQAHMKKEQDESWESNASV